MLLTQFLQSYSGSFVKTNKPTFDMTINYHPDFTQISPLLHIALQPLQDPSLDTVLHLAILFNLLSSHLCQFLTFLVFQDLSVLRITGHEFYRIPLSMGFSDVS